jgi:hypothetical protein
MPERNGFDEFHRMACEVRGAIGYLTKMSASFCRGLWTIAKSGLARIISLPVVSQRSLGLVSIFHTRTKGPARGLHIGGGSHAGFG